MSIATKESQTQEKKLTVQSSLLVTFLSAFSGHEYFWYLVLCLTGVDYFSSLGYAPGISMVAGHVAAPFLTLMLVGLTFLVAYVYRHIAAISFKGQGSLAIFANMWQGWIGKVIILFFLSFALVAIWFTISLSAADAAAHIEGNPLIQIPEGIIIFGMTLRHFFLIMLLTFLVGGLFLIGLEKALIVTVIAVMLYMSLNAVVILRGMEEVIFHPTYLTNWYQAFSTTYNGNLFSALGDAFGKFPKTVLGLSGFETAIAVIVYIRGYRTDTEDNPVGRIRYGRMLVLAAAVIMSVYLIGSIVVSTLLLPVSEVLEGGKAHDRVMAYLAHSYLGDSFGTVYDFSTIIILTFAGASAVAAFINLVPIYLPKSGMAPKILENHKIMISVIMVACTAITLIFAGDVQKQAAPYGTGVVGLLDSGALGMTLYSIIQVFRATLKKAWIVTASISSLVTGLLFYTLVILIRDDPSGIIIVGFTFVGLFVFAFTSRMWRSTELRCGSVLFDQVAEEAILHAIQFNKDAKAEHKVPNGRYPGISIIMADGEENGETEAEYEERYNRTSDLHHIPFYKFPHLFLVIEVPSGAQFEAQEVKVFGYKYGQNYVLRCKGVAVPNTIVCVLRHIRDKYNCRVDGNFAFSTGDPKWHAARFFFSGDGNIPTMAWDIARKQALLEKKDKNGQQCPVVLHVGGNPEKF